MLPKGHMVLLLSYSKLYGKYLQNQSWHKLASKNGIENSTPLQITDRILLHRQKFRQSNGITPCCKNSVFTKKIVKMMWISLSGMHQKLASIFFPWKEIDVKFWCHPTEQNIVSFTKKSSNAITISKSNSFWRKMCFYTAFCTLLLVHSVEKREILSHWKKNFVKSTL